MAAAIFEVGAGAGVPGDFVNLAAHRETPGEAAGLVGDELVAGALGARLRLPAVLLVGEDGGDPLRVGRKVGHEEARVTLRAGALFDGDGAELRIGLEAAGEGSGAGDGQALRPELRAR